MALLMSAPPALAQDSFDPGVDQYSESLPTSKGKRVPAVSRDPNSLALPPEVRAQLAGRRLAGELTGVPGAEGGGGALRDTAGRLGDFRPGQDAPLGSPSALSSVVETVTDAGGIVWLLLGLGVVTILAVSRALVRQRRAQD
ncbi:MAG: hypothetical protein M3N16_08750 [Actinomycetota bacterium]|nr:hypothetical protein [Actinomycetota bacterium]